jgi:hypothetical protein
MTLIDKNFLKLSKICPSCLSRYEHLHCFVLCVLLTMPVASATAEMSFSVLRHLKTYVRSTMKNDRISSLGLMHINRDNIVSIEG